MIRRIISFILVLLGASAVYFYLQFEPAQDIQWGVNFSIPRAEYLGFEWKKMYLDILEELQPQLVRTMAYWEIIEPAQDKLLFPDLDFILEEAQKRNIGVIVVLGHKQPGWPECHSPEWVRNLESRMQNEELLEYITAVVERYKTNNAIKAWQVENEPFFPYGPSGCDPVPLELFQKEIALVKSLDPRPIVVTDSGEKGAWLPTAQYGDIFGSTMYREIYHDKKQKYIKYPVPPALYRIRAGMLKVFLKTDKFIGVELQAEPWFATDVFQTPWERQKELMNEKIFAEYTDYARRVGFAQNYFWGVEWWYYAKHKQGDDSIWQAAKKVMSE